MKKEEIKSQKELEELRHKNKLIELEIFHKHKLQEIQMEKEAKIVVELAMYDHKMSFHRLKRSDEKRKREEWGEDKYGQP